MLTDRKSKATLAVAVLAALLLAGLPAAAEELWFHVKVREHDGDQGNVTVNLPFSIIEKTLPLLPEDALHDGRIRLDHDRDLDAQELRALWKAVTDSPDMTFVTVESNRDKVHVAKDKQYLLVRSDEREGSTSHVDVRIPLDVVDALLSGTGDELDFKAALEALAKRGEGELVSVDDHDATVRIWIDHVAEAR
jgi:hypothetical protein